MSTSASQRIGRYRWVVCALLFFATTINYIRCLAVEVRELCADAEIHLAFGFDITTLVKHGKENVLAALIDIS